MIVYTTCSGRKGGSSSAGKAHLGAWHRSVESVALLSDQTLQRCAPQKGARELSGVSGFRELLYTADPSTRHETVPEGHKEAAKGAMSRRSRLRACVRNSGEVQSPSKTCLSASKNRRHKGETPKGRATSAMALSEDPPRWQRLGCQRQRLGHRAWH